MKISCPFCDGHIEFDLKDEGEAVPCPHCQRGIILKGSAGFRLPKFRLASEKRTQAWQFWLLLGLLGFGTVGVSTMQKVGSEDTGRAVVSGLWALFALVLALGIYFAPTIVAAWRQHRQYTPIFVVNLFLGWTLVGWVAALAWAFWTEERKV